MTRKQQIEKQIDAALNSLNHVQPASPAPFFYTRLMARMTKEEKSIWGRLSRTITRPATAAFSLALIIGVNIFAVLQYTPAAAPKKADQTEIALAEYNRAASVYDIDNVQP